MELKVHVLFRCSKKTGKVDTTMTALGPAILKMWALNNTTSTKQCLIFERESGNLIYATDGTNSGFPKVRDAKKTKLGMCEDFGIPLTYLHGISDDRFDKVPEVF